MPAPSIRSSRSNQPNSGSTGTTAPVIMPASVSAGDLLLVVLWFNHFDVPVAPAGWSLIRRIAGSTSSPSGPYTAYYFAKDQPAAGTEAGTTVTFTGFTSGYGNACAVAIKDASSVNVLVPLTGYGGASQISQFNLGPYSSTNFGATLIAFTGSLNAGPATELAPATFTKDAQYDDAWSSFTVTLSHSATPDLSSHTRLVDVSHNAFWLMGMLLEVLPAITPGGGPVQSPSQQGALAGGYY